jgi:histidine decarboxylase
VTFTSTVDAIPVAEELERLRRRIEADRPTNIGFPGAVAFNYADLLPFFGHLLNNVGDPSTDGVGRAHTKHLEREVVQFCADLFRAPPDDRWGYVTSGGTEGNEFGLYLARNRYPNALVFYSAAAHYSVAKVADRLRMPAIPVRASATGEMDYDALRLKAARHRCRSAIVVATVGTTMTEAVDDVGLIRQALADAAVTVSYVHADAALAGIPLALVAPNRRPGFDFADGADSIAISGHKFVGSPFPCGVVLTRRSLRDGIARRVDYIDSVDATVGGSRSGHAPLLLWYAFRRHGRDGLRLRAERSRELAEYATSRLAGIGVPAWRHRHAFTVVLPTPPSAVTDRWALASADGLSHIVCVPGVRREQIDALVADLSAC